MLHLMRVYSFSTIGSLLIIKRMVELQKEVNTIEGFRGTISDILFYSESLLISASGPKLIFYNLKEKKIVKEVKVLNSWFKIVAIRALE